MASITKGTWRHNVINLEAGKVLEFVYKDTRPTFIQAINGASFNPLFVSNSPNISTSIYEAKINPDTDKLVTFPDSINIVYLLCNEPCSIILNSGEGEVSISDIHQTADINVITTGQSDVNVISIQNPLPSGTNNIGHVNVDGDVTVSGEVEVKNDTGNPLPISGSVGITGTPSVNVNRDSFIPKKFTLSAGVDTTVKGSSGYVAIIQTGLSDLILKDGSTAVWLGQLQGAAYPIRMGTSIVLNSATGGDAYIAYL